MQLCIYKLKGEKPRDRRGKDIERHSKTETEEHGERKNTRIQKKIHRAILTQSIGCKKQED